MTGIMPPGPLSYQGQVSLPWINRTFAPNSNNTEFTIPTIWVDTAGKDAYILVSLENGTATWAPIGGLPGQTETITGNSGGAVGPDGSNNINIVGQSGQVNVVGDPSNNTLTISLAGGGTAIDTLTPNVGSAVSPNGAGTVLVNASTSTYTDGSVANTLKTEVQGTNHALFVGRGTNTPATTLGVATNGQIPIGSTGADPVLATLTAGSGIAIANGAGSITISADNSGMTWSVVTTNQTAGDNLGFLANAAGNVQVTLPASSNVGDTFEVCNIGTGSWSIAQGAGQSILLGNGFTTTGAGGSLASTARGDWVLLVCTAANTTWVACVKQGNITVV